jgi:LacI family transcriptional regulator
VQLWTQDETQGPCVGFDEHRAAALVIRQLADLGHRRLGFIGGHTHNNERAQARLIGLMRAIAQHGLLLREDVIIETDYGFQQGFDAMNRIRLLHSDVTAVVCGNDYLAAGALSALDLAGVRVPEQLSVISFNDNDFAPFLHPPLTTVHLPIREIGEHGARLLLARLRHETIEPLPSLPVTLMVRQSTGPVPVPN